MRATRAVKKGLSLQRWLLLLYQLPAKPSTLRVNVWRELKSCGVVYVQHSACVVPNRAPLRSKIEELTATIEKSRGEARLFVIAITDAKEQEELLGQFCGQAEEEYQEFLGRCKDFHEELAYERKKDHYSFAELEENEAELGKLRAWLQAIAQRDFFRVPLRRKAFDTLADCEKNFRRFGLEVARRQPIHGNRFKGMLTRSLSQPLKKLTA